MGSFEDQYNDTLRSMEIALVKAYRQHETMTDWEALNALNGLLRMYTAEQRRRTLPNITLKPLAQQSFDALKVTCDGWLGRAPLIDEFGQVVQLGDNALTLTEVINCLKRIRKSVEMWQKEGGQRGYFNFVDQFLPPDVVG